MQRKTDRKSLVHVPTRTVSFDKEPLRFTAHFCRLKSFLMLNKHSKHPVLAPSGNYLRILLYRTGQYDKSDCDWGKII